MRMFLILITLLFSLPAYADNLDESKVRQYLQTLVDVYTTDKVDDAMVNHLLKKHVDEKAVIIMKTSANKSPDREVKNLTLDDLLKANNDKNLETLDSSARYTLTSVKYNQDQGLAVIKYTFWQNSKIKKVSKKGQIAILDYRSEARCEEHISSNEGIIKIHSSICDVDVFYDKPYLVSE